MGAPSLDDLDLAPPPAAADTVRHDPTFESWDAQVCGLRDLANQGIHVLNGLGVDLRPLPGGSLRELLVEPLTGDHAEIRRTAAACHVVRRALVTVSTNQGALVPWAGERWAGQAAQAQAGALRARALTTWGLAELVGRAAPVLDEVADFSEWLTIEVERLVVECGERLGRLVRTLLSRVSGPLGWGVFAWEIGTQGLSALTDLVDDVRRVLEIVETLLTLQDTVFSWAREQRDRLETLLDLPEVVRAIA